MNHCLFRILLLVALSCASTAYAVTLGKPRVLSFLGQPLEAEIDLVGLEPDQQKDLSLRIADAPHFERLGILHNAFLDALTFDVARTDGRWVVRARSAQAVLEPYLDFPLQVSWPGGQLVKQYTLLLEPPAHAQAIRATPESRAAPDGAPSPTAKYGDNYGPVRYGEILTAVAQQLKPDGTTTWQMSIVLFRANPHAFTDGNINKLRVGSTLSIPQLDVIRKLDNPSAIAEFAAETTRWLVPTATSRGNAEISENNVPDAAPKSSVTARGQRGGQELADRKAAQEPVGDAQRKAVTEKYKTDADHEDRRGMHQQLLVAMEDVETHRITNDSVEPRIERMEAQLAGMQKLLELKNLQLDAIQAEAADRRAIQAMPKTAESRPTSNAQPTGRPWHEGYIWAAWVALGLAALSILLWLRRRSSVLTEHGYVLGLPQADRTDVKARPVIAQTSPAAQLGEAEDDLDSPPEQSANESIVELQADIPEAEEPDTPEYEATGAVLPEEDHVAPLDAMPDSEDLSHSEPGHTAENRSNVSEVELACWAAELDEDIEHGGDGAAPGGTTERPRDQSDLSQEEPIQLEEDVASFTTEPDDPLPADVPLDAPIPTPIELGSTKDTDGDGDGDASSGKQLDLVSGIGEDQDFSLSLDLARAYLEIGDEEGAEEILQRALAGAPEPGYRRQMEELLARIG